MTPDDLPDHIAAEFDVCWTYQDQLRGIWITETQAGFILLRVHWKPTLLLEMSTRCGREALIPWRCVEWMREVVRR
jgi:hypothetical protein